MRTNIELDDDLLSEAAKYSTVRSKRAIVHEALATYVAVKHEERQRRSYRERLQGVRSRAAGTRLRTDTRDLLRKDRDTR
jgi:Arc/MetJ family transcription regulator